MTTHRYHPDPERGDPKDAVLWDECPRCEEHITAPQYSCDEDILVALQAISDGITKAVTSAERDAAYNYRQWRKNT